MNDAGSGYEHEDVIHRKGRFVKMRADGIQISTNAIEGMFGRTKRLLRIYRAKPDSAEDYGVYLGEFLVACNVSFYKTYWSIWRMEENGVLGDFAGMSSSFYTKTA